MPPCLARSASKLPHPREAVPTLSWSFPLPCADRSVPPDSCPVPLVSSWLWGQACREQVMPWGGAEWKLLTTCLSLQDLGL